MLQRGIQRVEINLSCGTDVCGRVGGGMLQVQSRQVKLVGRSQFPTAGGSVAGGGTRPFTRGAG